MAEGKSAIGTALQTLEASGRRVALLADLLAGHGEGEAVFSEQGTAGLVEMLSDVQKGIEDAQAQILQWLHETAPAIERELAKSAYATAGQG